MSHNSRGGSKSQGDGSDEPSSSPVEAPGQAQDGVAPDARAAAGRVRKRTSRACDMCNQSRTKCDGKYPCGHCIETGLTCEYARVPKKRGKMSKKDIAKQAALKEQIAAEQLCTMHNNNNSMSSTNTTINPPSSHVYSAGQELPSQPPSQSRQLGDLIGDQLGAVQSPAAHSHGSSASHLGHSSISDRRPTPKGAGELASHYADIDFIGPFGDLESIGLERSAPETEYRNQHMDFSNLYMGMEAVQGQSSSLPGMSYALNSPPVRLANARAHSLSHIKHPVLLPLFPYLKNIMPPALAFELLEHFFASASPEFPHPVSPYHITTSFRKKSFLGPENPRRCSPALLASMLWSAAWTSDARALASPPSARARLCQRLLNLCVFLLNPLVHGDRLGKGAPDAERNGVSKAHPMGVQEMTSEDDVPVKIACGTLDDVITYIHIAIVISASEDKGASLRWWTAAWNLAKELRLGSEVDANARTGKPESFFLRADLPESEGQMNMEERDLMCEEEREERRRVWWTLYLVDRHLSLCYNRRLMLLDSECIGLARPMDEVAWQEGHFGVQAQPPHAQARSQPSYRPWPDRHSVGRFDFTGPSTFGYFLPLSTVLGEIIDLHQRRMHPYLGQARDDSGDLVGYDAQVRSICHHQLETYEHSLRQYREKHIPALQSGVPDKGRRLRLTETQYQIATACAYGEHLMHVMYILLHDKWDPATLLADEDLWTSTSAFASAVSHAVRGADAVADILHYDPQISFNPFLYGIYLLQGSFLLLVMADRLVTEANEQTITACETIVRAHEACVVTLNTEYQRAFRRCMQSALAQAKGRMPQDGGEQQRRRRETLSLYRWIGDGEGLAV